jgi:UDP-glucose 4-epimerase
MSNWQDSTWLVTGGCGFIGSNLVQRLCQADCRVRVLDNFSITRDVPDARAEVVEGDVRDWEAVRAAVDGSGVVIHLAAQSGVIPSIEDPRKDFEVNVGGTLNLLMACRDAGVKRLVFASSNAALGEVPAPFEETKVPHPLSPYGASKLAGEAYCLAFGGSFGLQTVALRFANAYGPLSSHKNSAVAKFLKRALAGQPIIIYGDGTQTRDFVYVDDVCDAILLATEADCAAEVFHIASAVETRIIDLARLIQDVVGQDTPIVHEERRQGEAYRISASIEKAHRLLGFSPKVAMEEGVKRTYDWFARHYRPSEALPGGTLK